MSKPKQIANRDDGLLKVIANAERMAQAGAAVDDNAVAVALWITDPGEGILDALIQHGYDQWNRPTQCSLVKIVYEQKNALFGDTAWDKEGSDENRRHIELDRQLRLAGMVSQKFSVASADLGAFLNEWGAPKIELDHLRALLDGVRATNVSAERVEVVKRFICSDDPAWQEWGIDLFRHDDYLKILVNHHTPAMQTALRNAPQSIRIAVVEAAIYSDRLHWLQDALENGMSVGAQERRYGLRLLHMAAMTNTEATKILLDAGADIHQPDGLGSPALHYAIDSVERCRLIVEKGADLNAINEMDATALHAMLEPPVMLRGDEMVKRLEVIAFMLESGADPFYVPANASKTYLTPFQHAVKVGRVEQVSLVAERCGVDLGQRTVAGRSLAQLAGQNKNDKGMRDFLRSVKTELSVKSVMPEEGSVASARRKPCSPL